MRWTGLPSTSTLTPVMGSPEGERTVSLDKSKVKASTRIRRSATNQETLEALGSIVDETAAAIGSEVVEDGDGGVPA